MPPNKLYNFPQTTTQEIGWFSSHHLLNTDRRLYKPIPSSDVTEYGHRLIKQKDVIRK
jgi:hypothetical protein